MTADPPNQEYMEALEDYLANGYGPGVCARLLRVQAAEAALNRQASDKVRQRIATKILSQINDKNGGTAPSEEREKD